MNQNIDQNIDNQQFKTRQQVVGKIGEWLSHHRRASNLGIAQVIGICRDRFRFINQRFMNQPSINQLSEDQLHAFETGTMDIPGAVFFRLAEIYRVDPGDVLVFLEDLKTSVRQVQDK